MTQDTNTASGAADLLDLIEAYAEVRHRHGHSSYNGQTQEAREKVMQAFSTAPAQPDPAYSAACNLATALFKKHFAHLPDYASGQVVWGLCDSTAGVISQIDNMVSGLVQPPTTSPQAADSVQEDAARLDFLIDQRAYVVSDPDACPGHWLHWARPDGSTWVQGDEHPTPRAAIDAARKQGASHE